MRIKGNRRTALAKLQLHKQVVRQGGAESFCKNVAKAAPTLGEVTELVCCWKWFWPLYYICLFERQSVALERGAWFWCLMEFHCWTCMLVNDMALWTYFLRSKLLELLWGVALMHMKCLTLHLTQEGLVNDAVLSMSSVGCRLCVVE